MLFDIHRTLQNPENFPIFVHNKNYFRIFQIYFMLLGLLWPLVQLSSSVQENIPLQIPLFYRSRRPPEIPLIKQLIKTIFYTYQMRGNKNIVVTSEWNVRNWSGFRCTRSEKVQENENGAGLFTTFPEKVITVSLTSLYLSRSSGVN